MAPAANGYHFVCELYGDLGRGWNFQGEATLSLKEKRMNDLPNIIVAFLPIGVFTKFPKKKKQKKNNIWLWVEYVHIAKKGQKKERGKNKSAGLSR